MEKQPSLSLEKFRKGEGKEDLFSRYKQREFKMGSVYWVVKVDMH